MKKLIRVSLLMAVLACMAVTVQAQKFGYVFSLEIISEFPEKKQADTNLETLQNQLQKKFESMYATAQQKAKKFQDDYEAGNLSPKAQQEAQEAMAKEEKKILDFQKEIQEKITKKREELYGPILEKVDAAIKEVAKEGGYTMVFNADTQILLYAADETNLTDKVKAKVGML